MVILFLSLMVIFTAERKRLSNFVRGQNEETLSEIISNFG